MYITLNGNLVNLKNLQKCFIDNNRIILQYLVNGTIITDSLNYENVKIDVNEELQLIEKDFQKIQDNLDGKTEEKIKQLEQKVKEQDQKIKDLNQDKITNEFLRGDEIRGFAFGLSTSQLISVLIEITLIAYIITVYIKKHKDKSCC